MKSTRFYFFPTNEFAVRSLAALLAILFTFPNLAFPQNRTRQKGWSPEEIHTALSKEKQPEKRLQLYQRLFGLYKKSNADSALTVANSMILEGEQRNNPVFAFAGNLRKAAMFLSIGKVEEGKRYIEAARKTPHNMGVDYQIQVLEAVVLQNTGRVPESKPLLEQVILAAKNAQDTQTLIPGLALTVKYHFMQSDFAKAQEASFEILRLSEQSKKPVEQCFAYQILSLPYIMAVSDSTKFFYYAERCLELAIPYEIHADAAEIYTRISAFHKVKRRKEEALQYAELAAETMKKTGILSRYAALLTGAGWVHMNFNEPKSAAPHFEKAFKVMKQLNSEFEQAITLRGFGNALFDAGEREKGLAYLLQAYQICTRNGFREMEKKPLQRP